MKPPGELAMKAKAMILVPSMGYVECDAREATHLTPNVGIEPPERSARMTG